jgi:hypothetical protein
LFFSAPNRPKTLPPDTTYLKYPSRAGKQLALLNLMHKKPAFTSAKEAGSTENPGPSTNP